MASDALLDRMVRAIVDEVDPEQVILFGSWARGEGGGGGPPSRPPPFQVGGEKRRRRAFLTDSSPVQGEE